MKKTITFALVLLFLLLAGCGSVPETQTGSSVPPSIFPEETSALELFTDPASLPDFGFPIDSIWVSDSFGKNGSAIFFLGDVKDDRRNCMLIFSQYYQQKYYEGSENYDYCTVELLGNYDLKADAPIMLADSSGSIEVNINLSIEGDGMSIDYLSCKGMELSINNGFPSARHHDPERPEYDYVFYFPNVFSELNFANFWSTWYTLPLCSLEIGLPIDSPASLSEYIDVFGEPKDFDGQYYHFGGEEYSAYAFSPDSEKLYFSSVFSVVPDFLPHVRGIEPGYPADEVLRRFPNNAGDFEQILKDTSNNGRVVLYGCDRQIEESRKCGSKLSPCFQKRMPASSPRLTLTASLGA